MPKVTWLRSGRVRDGAHITSPSAQYSFWFVIPASLNPNLCCYWILKLFFIWHECVCGATSNTQQEYLLGWSNCCNKQPSRSQQLAARVVGRVKTASCSHWGIQAPPIFFTVILGTWPPRSLQGRMEIHMKETCIGHAWKGNSPLPHIFL